MHYRVTYRLPRTGSRPYHHFWRTADASVATAMTFDAEPDAVILLVIPDQF